MPGSKRIVFTINNPKGGNICALNKLFESDDVEWGCFQFEEASTGTVHLQGAIYFNERVPLAKCCRLLTGVKNGCRGHCADNPIVISDDEDEISGAETEIYMSPDPE